MAQNQVFDPSLAPALVGVLCMALQASPRSARKVAIIALTLRNEDTFSNFLQTAGTYSELIIQPLQLTYPWNN